ncbi:MAG: hypothetical protein COB73_00880 [Flavobacteriaceae bacterium]|nr:MAG: hypothetical protein COB73_00880 [Flavobacteriaceae bacterium]
MDKIKLELNNERLNAINLIWDYLSKENHKSMEQRSMYDLVMLLRQKFLKKSVEKEFALNDFSIKLYYYEAFFLVKAIDVCTSKISLSAFPFEYNILMSISNYLRQKMA